MDFQPQIGRSVSLEQAERELQVSRRTLYYWIRDGRLQTIRTIGGSQRVLIESLRQCEMARRAEGQTALVNRPARYGQVQEVFGLA